MHSECKKKSVKCILLHSNAKNNQQLQNFGIIKKKRKKITQNSKIVKDELSRWKFYSFVEMFKKIAKVIIIHSLINFYRSK